MERNNVKKIALKVLKELIKIPSFSCEEEKTADFLEIFFRDNGFSVNRKFNNVWINKLNGKHLPTVLLNSHIDTIKPGHDWTFDPFIPEETEERIYGLGSNDARASVVSLLAVFLLLSARNELPYNLVLALTAEEEISGDKGVSAILDELGKIDLGIVGEPTGMNLAIAEKGLMVLDCVAHGKRSHAALNQGLNAIYKAVADMEWIINYQFAKRSELLGEVTMQVTQIKGGEAHNIVPAQCDFVIDVRTNECYSNKEVFDIICNHISSNVSSRSFRLNPSSISTDHPVVRRARQIGIECVGSATLSDQALMPFQTVKIGPGDSRRSHTADEFITTIEIFNGIDIYMNLLHNLELS